MTYRGFFDLAVLHLFFLIWLLSFTTQLYNENRLSLSCLKHTRYWCVLSIACTFPPFTPIGKVPRLAPPTQAWPHTDHLLTRVTFAGSKRGNRLQIGDLHGTARTKNALVKKIIRYNQSWRLYYCGLIILACAIANGLFVCVIAFSYLISCPCTFLRAP